MTLLSLSLSLSAGRKKYDVLTFLGRHPQPSSSPSSFLRPSIPSLPSSLLFAPSFSSLVLYSPCCFPSLCLSPFFLLLLFFFYRSREGNGKESGRDVGARVGPLHRGECITSPRLLLLSSLAGSTAECGSIRSFVSERQHATRGTGRRRGGRLGVSRANRNMLNTGCPRILDFLLAPL